MGARGHSHPQRCSPRGGCSPRASLTQVTVTDLAVREETVQLRWSGSASRGPRRIWQQVQAPDHPLGTVSWAGLAVGLQGPPPRAGDQASSCGVWAGCHPRALSSAAPGRWPVAHFLVFPSLFSSQRSALPTSVGFVQVTHPFPKGASVSPRGGWGAVSVHPTFLGPSGLGELPGGVSGCSPPCHARCGHLDPSRCPDSRSLTPRSASPGRGR